MTKISPYELPTTGSAENTDGGGQPSPAAHLDDDGGDIVFQHFSVSSNMFAFFGISAAHAWSDGGHHWYDVIITAIVFLYSTVMIHLILIKRRDRNKRRQLEASQVVILCTSTDFVTSALMVVATAIMLISLGVSVFIFRPAWSDLAYIAFMLSFSMGSVFLLFKLGQINRKKMLQEKSEGVSDLV